MSITMPKPLLLTLLMASITALPGCGSKEPTIDDVTDIINSNINKDCFYVTASEDFMIKSSDGSYDMKFHYQIHNKIPINNVYSLIDSSTQYYRECIPSNFAKGFVDKIVQSNAGISGGITKPLAGEVTLQMSDQGWVGQFNDLSE